MPQMWRANKLSGDITVIGSWGRRRPIRRSPSHTSQVPASLWRQVRSKILFRYNSSHTNATFQNGVSNTSRGRTYSQTPVCMASLGLGTLSSTPEGPDNRNPNTVVGGLEHTASNVREKITFGDDPLVCWAILTTR